MEPIQLQEFEWYRLTADELMRDGRLDIAEGFGSERYLTVRLRTDGIELQPRGYVGFIPLNDRVSLYVRPRVEIGNLDRVLRLSGQAPTALLNVLRDYRRSGELFPTLVRFYADGLKHVIDQITTFGFMREYERREEITSQPRGRILIGPTIAQAARGNEHRAAVSWHARSIDIPVNRCLLYAVHRLAQYNIKFGRAGLVNDHRKVARVLNACHNQLRGVTLDPRAGFLQDPLVQGRAPLPAMREYYRPGLALASAIIRGEGVSITDSGGDVRLPSLLMNMSDVFESYLRNVLDRISRSERWGVRVLNGKQKPKAGARKASLFDTESEFEAEPDIVLARGDGKGREHPVILEVKYKPAERGVDRDDLNQTIAYGVSYRAPQLIVVQPKGDGAVVPGVSPIGTLAGISVARYVFDLDAADLEAEERRFAATVHRVLQMASAQAA